MNENTHSLKLRQELNGIVSEACRLLELVRSSPVRIESGDTAELAAYRIIEIAKKAVLKIERTQE
jgi:hypothetical protein